MRSKTNTNANQNKKKRYLHIYHSNSDSSEAFNQLLLQIPRKNNNASLTGGSKDYDSTNLSLPVFHFLIRNPCKDIIHIGANAEESTLNWYVMKIIENDSKYQEHDQEKVKLKLVKDAINFITDSCFQSGCVLTFKKLTNVCVYKRKI